jgi:beta-lactamase class A
MRLLLLVAALIGLVMPAQAGTLELRSLSASFSEMARNFPGKVGICAQVTVSAACTGGDERFPMQSVVKLVVALAVLDAVDRGALRLDDAVVVRKEDLSVGPQPIAKLVTPEGYRTTIDDLLSRMVIDSDSAAYGLLLARVGGPAAVQALLDRRQLGGIRFDRDEVQINMELLGLEWRAEFVDANVLKKALAEVAPGRRQQLFDAYLADTRDTATPKGMTDLLVALQSGRLLSPASTQRLLEIMSQTRTFPDRLPAGLPPGWKIGHKTGTGPTWNGVASATNDVGILTAPDGGKIAVAVFVTNSRQSDKLRAAFIADVARKVAQSYH